MRRLKKKADTADAKKLLDRINVASDDLKDTYYVLFDNLNALFEAYPNLYKQIEMVVKLPTNDEAKDVVQFHDTLHEVLTHFGDEQYLNSYINPAVDQEQPAEQTEQPQESTLNPQPEENEVPETPAV